MAQKNATKSNQKKQDPAPVSKWKQLRTLFNRINHILIGFVVIYMTFLAKTLNFSDTSLHALLATSGFHLLAAEALMCYHPENLFTQHLSYKNKLRLHTALQIVGGGMGLLAGLGKISKTEDHFTTIHGKFGLATILLCLASMLGGIASLFPVIVKKFLKPSEIRIRHKLFGLLTFTAAMSTIFLGYNTKFFYKYVDSQFIPFISTVTLVVWLLTFTGSALALLGKISNSKST